MKLQESKPLSTAYAREEAFSSDLANHLLLRINLAERIGTIGGD